MNATRVYKSVALTLLVVAIGSQQAFAQPSPNVIYIIVDDAGLGDFSPFTPGTPVSTPNIQAMADGGMSFTRAYSSAPVCAPARSSLMTGYHMGHASMRSNGGGAHIFHSEVTVAEVMKTAGYATGGFGKWGLGNPGTTGAAERQGFDHFYGYYNQVHAHNHYSSFQIENGLKRVILENIGAPRNGLVSPQHSHSFNLYTEKMRDFIRDKATSGEPFFAYGPWTPPHHDNSIPADEPLYQQYANVPGWNQATKIQATFISMIDREVGRIMDIVDDPNGDGDHSDSVAGNTLIVFVSDNGGADGALVYDRNPGLRGEKRTAYEGGLRVPMIASWPGTVAPGSTSDLLTSFSDVMPTLAELAGASAAVPQDIDGLSIVPTLTGQGTQTEHEFFYSEFDAAINNGGTSSRMQGLVWDKEDAGITTTWKLVKPNPAAATELYKLLVDGVPVDPAEANNLAASNPAIVAQMQAIIDAERVDERIQLDTNPRDGNVTAFGLRPTARTIGSLVNGSFEDPQLTPADPNNGQFLNEGAVGWAGGIVQNVPNTEAIIGGELLINPVPDGNQVGVLDSGTGATNEYTQALSDGAGDPWTLYLDDLEQVWALDLFVGRRADGLNAPSTLLVELLGDSGFSYLSTTLDTGSIALGEMDHFNLSLDLTTAHNNRATLTSDLGGGLTLRLANVGGGGQILIDQVQLSVLSDFLPGDFDDDFDIDVADWLVLRDQLLAVNGELPNMSLYAQGDINFDGAIDSSDFLLFRQSFLLLNDNDTEAFASIVSHPEPSTLAVLILGLCGVSRRRVRRGSCRADKPVGFQKVAIKRSSVLSACIAIAILSMALAPASHAALTITDDGPAAPSGSLLENPGNNSFTRISDPTSGALRIRGTSFTTANDPLSLSAITLQMRLDNAGVSVPSAGNNGLRLQLWEIGSSVAPSNGISLLDDTGDFPLTMSAGEFFTMNLDSTITLDPNTEYAFSVEWASSAGNDIYLAQSGGFGGANDTLLFNGSSALEVNSRNTGQDLTFFLQGAVDPGQRMTLEIDTTSGALRMKGPTSENQDVFYYQVDSANGLLNTAGWYSLQDQDFEGSGAPGDGMGWEEAGGSGASALAEAFLLGHSTMTATTTINMGRVFDVDAGFTPEADLSMLYRLADGSLRQANIVTFTGLLGDFDGDGDRDATDIDGLLQAVFAGLNSPIYDMTGDGQVTQADADEWVFNAEGTFYGDANLDHAVSLLDLNTLGMNFGQAGGWAEGDFNGDQTISLIDLNTLGLNFGASSPSSGESIPEPVSLALFAVGVMARARRR